MIITFKYGFNQGGVPYGWHEKKLYRLPYTNNYNMSFPLKEINHIMIGNNVGYRIGGNKFTIDQLKEKTVLINYKHSIILDKDCPF